MLVVTDGASGLTEAMEELWPDSDRQRCAVHRWRSVAGKLPKNDTQLHERVEAAYLQVASLDQHRERGRPFAWSQRSGKVL
jgi:transposase-like protein